MFVCMFLPAYTQCAACDTDSTWSLRVEPNTVHYPLDGFPSAIVGPYVFAIAVAFCAFVVGPRTLRAAFWVVRAALATVLVLTLSSPIEAIVPVVLLIITGISNRDEARLGVVVGVAGVFDILFFGVPLLFAKEPLVGGLSGLWAAVGTLLGGVLWQRAARSPPAEPPQSQLPKAVVHRGANATGTTSPSPQRAQ
jgi:hypothetical protein